CAKFDAGDAISPENPGMWGLEILQTAAGAGFTEFLENIGENQVEYLAARSEVTDSGIYPGLVPDLEVK
ncbi:MAG: hypothetical protein K9K38_10375, partial [Rhodoferax sp.]|nr:hypothetical protein [Rhodoferax sp.]MCF8209793.1 hypothetical protein [Rhodoferax sp.]